MTKKIILVLLAVLSVFTCFAMVACDNGSVDEKHQHKHTYSEKWEYDSKQHWHLSLCTEEGCPKTSEKQDHDFINGYCYICGYEKTSSGRQDPTKTAGFSCENIGGSWTLMKFSPAITNLEIDNFDGQPIVAVMSAITSDTTYRNLKRITFGDSVQTVGISAFENCPNLEEIIIKNSAISIGERAFANCTKLKKITIGNRAVAFYSNAFEGCTALSEGGVHVADLESWCNIRFSNENANPLSFAGNLYVGDEDELVEDVVISDKLKEINSYAFYNCKSIKSLTIPNSVTIIGKDAFAQCVELKDVNFTGSLSEWCQIFFSSKDSNPISNVKKLSINGNLLVKADIPEGVNNISNFAFIACESITEVSLPKSLLTIGDSIFEGANNITQVEYKGNQEDWQRVAIGKNNDNWLELLK